MVRGDVHAVELPRSGGRVQHGRRFAIIVQANDLLALSTVAICPTSQSTPAASFHPEVEVEGERTRVLCEMLRALDTQKLGRRVGHLSIDEIAAVDDGLSLVLDLGR